MTAISSLVEYLLYVLYQQFHFAVQPIERAR